VGTQVSVGGTTAFATIERVVVPRGRFNGVTITPGQKTAGVVAVQPGLGGNVPAGAIDTVDDASVRAFLRGSPDNPNSLVTNLEPTGGGLETPHTVIQQADADAVVAAIEADLAAQLATALAEDADRLYAGPPPTELAEIDVPVDLVGLEDQATFDLTGTLAFDRAYVMTEDLDAAARAALEGDPSALPEGTTVLADSIVVEPGARAVNGEEMTVAVTVRAAAAAAIDEAAVRDLVTGKTIAEAMDALADQGEVRIDLWPDWFDQLPRIGFRIIVRTVAPSAAPSPSP
jgi:hypothetical protein